MVSEKISESFFGKAILNSLDSNICLLDENGNIESVNDSWLAFAKENNAAIEKVSEGCNYLEACDEAEGEERDTAKKFAAGLRSVIQGKKEKFELEYPCHTPSHIRWFLTRVTPYLDHGNTSSRKVIVCHIDITVKKQSEKIIKENEKLFREYFNNAPVGINVVDTKGNYLDANLTSAKVLGYNKEELLNFSVFDLVDESYHYRIEQGLKQLEVHDHTKGEVIMHTKDVKKIWVEVYATKLDEDKILSFSNDVTDRKEAEEALKRSEDKFKAYMKMAPVGIFVAGSEGRFLEVNPEACRMRGYTREELLNSKFIDILPSASRQEASEHFKKLQETGRAESTLMGKTKDGSIFWYDNLAVKINKDLYISFQTDVTRRVESEEKFRALFEQNLLAFYLHDFEGNIIDVNNEACSQSGYSYNELVKMKVIDFIYPKDNGGIFSESELLNLWKEMELGERTTVEDIHQRKDGSIFNVEISTGIIHFNNRNIVMALAKDITPRKKAEERTEYLSFHDALTGLYNRAYLNEEMKRKNTIRQLPISIIMLDLNGLKIVNDTYGHAVGDEMLKIAAEILINSCRKEDTIARYGGDKLLCFCHKLMKKK